jgi:hypothetical protein
VTDNNKGAFFLAQKETVEDARDLLTVESRIARRTSTHYWLLMLTYKVDNPANNELVADLDTLRGSPIVICANCHIVYDDHVQNACITDPETTLE